MTARLSNPLAFVLGVSFALLPSYAPFVAIMVLVSKRFALSRRDFLWAAGALLSGVALGAHEGTKGVLLGFAQFLGPWLVFRAFQQLSGEYRLRDLRKSMSMGLIVGLAAVVVGGLSGVQAFHFGTAKTIAQAIEWGGPAGLYGHAILTIGAIIAALAPSANLRVIALGLSALGILASGSREAAIAWVFVSLGLLVVGRRGSRVGRVVELAMLVVMVGIAAGLGPSMGWGRVGFLVDLTPAATTSNMLQGTEIAKGDWWDPMGVRVESHVARVDGRELMVYDVHKAAPEGWQRLQQVVRLEPGRTYTVGTYLRPDSVGGRAGIQGYGETDSGQVGFILTGALVGDSWMVGRNGDGVVLSSSMVDAGDGWKHVRATFRYDGTSGLTYWLGLAPDQRDGGMASASFAGFMLTPGVDVGGYVPGSASHGLSLADARLPYWRAAWSGFLERPVLGWGPGAFAGYYESRTHGADRLQEVPTHAHNFILQQLFERGFAGLIAAMLLLAALSADAVKRRDLAVLVVLGGVLLANVFDNTLFYGGVLYPLAAVTGWRAGVSRSRGETWSDSPRQMFVRLALVAVDTATAYVAVKGGLLLSAWFTGGEPGSVALSTTAIYALSIWPILAWREGLYPGYGLTAALELKKHVTAVVGAVLLLSAGTVVLSSELTFTPLALVLILCLGVFTLPIGRAIAKRLLLALNVWGRAVTVLGAGEAGARVVKSMIDLPSHGLHPVAIFDDDASFHATRVHGVPVRGRLADAEDFSAANHIKQVVVAIPSMPVEALRELVDRQGKTFERLQFLPHLPGLRSEDVYATSIDGMLTLEMRNGLVSPGNRMFKRSVDVLGSIALILVSSMLLVAIYLWVRLDSRGPAFHLSRRVGEGGHIFSCLKFRTMRHDAEVHLASLLESDPGLRAEYQHFHKLEDDPRVTTAGRVLRRLSLDELPQLFNVLIGQMSLVGPRPYLVSELPEIGSYRDILFRAKPGMTGHWQVTGRSEVTFAERLEMEAHYVRNWSFWWDMILLLQTPGVVVARRGAR